MNNDTNRCYFVENFDKVNQPQAKEKCNQLGASLISVGDQLEADFLEYMYVNIHKDYRS